MSEFTNYAEMIINNKEIWKQAVMVGILTVGSAGLMGWMLSAVSVFFKMLSRG